MELVVLCGRLVAPLYLEGCMVRNLIANNGKLPISVFEKHFENYNSYDDLFKRLLDRNVIDVVNKAVVLNNRNYQKGIQNRIMMWGTRKIKH